MTESPATGGERHLSPKRVALILRYMGDEPDGDDLEGPDESQVLSAPPAVVGTASPDLPARSANGTLDTAGAESVATYQFFGPSVRRRPFARLEVFVRARGWLLGWAALIVGVAVVIGLLIPHLA